MKQLWIYERATGRFRYGGFVALVAPDDPELDLIEVDGEELPDIEAERADPTSPTGRRPATAQELAAAATERADAEAARETDLKPFRVLAYWVLRRLLGRAPTAAEVQTAKTELRTIYRNL